MSNAESPDVGKAIEMFGQDLERARKHWWIFMLLGGLLTLGGIVAIAYPCITSVGAVMVLGVILTVSGVFLIVGAFWAGKWSALFLQLLVGIMYVMAGIALRNSPVNAMIAITMFLAMFFVVAGIFRILVAVIERFPQWGWALLNGVVTLLAGIIIFDSSEHGAFWVIGLLVGLELLFNGWTWIMLALVVRRLPTTEGEAANEPAASGG